MQGIRRTVKFGLPLVGMLVAFGGAIYVQEDLPRLFAVLIGILLIEVGAWNLANPFLPSTRRYLLLRAEVETFMSRVPDLNSAAVDARSSSDASDWERYRAVLSEMHASVDRMGVAAGQEAGMPDTRPPST